MFESFFQHIRSGIGEGEFLPIFDRFLSQESLRSAVELAWNEEISTRGRNVGLFETELAAFLEMDHALCTNSGSAALKLGLLSMGVEPDTFVLMPSMTYIATAAAAKQLGAEPIFMDTETELPLLSPQSLSTFLEQECEVRKEACFHTQSGKRISALIAVHLLGEVPDLQAIYTMAKRFHIPVLEDQAQGLGSEPFFEADQRTIILSFNGNKILKTGGGGALLSNNEILISKARHLASYAPQRDAWYTYDDIGYNDRMPAWNAALGRVQMSGLAEHVNGRRSRREDMKALMQNSGIRLLESTHGLGNARVNAVSVGLESQEEFLKAAKDHQVEVRPIWTPLHHSPPFRDLLSAGLPNTEKLAQEIFLLR